MKSSEDELLAQLAQKLKAEDELPEPLATLLDPQLPEDQRQSLREQAVHNPELSRALALSEPLGEDFSERILEEYNSGEKVAEAPASSRSRLTWIVSSGAIGLCLAALLIFQGPAENYHMEVSGGYAAVRSEIQERSFPPGAPLTIILRPQQRVDSELTVLAFVQKQQQWQPLVPEVERAESGVIRLQTRLPEHLPQGSEWKITVVMLPERGEAAQAKHWLDSPSKVPKGVHILQSTLPVKRP